MKTTVFVILALSVGNSFSAVFHARAPEVESMRVAPRAKVSDIDIGLSVMQEDTRKRTDTSSDLEQRFDGDSLQKRWSEAC
ncbi:MAG: hypothetical protein M1830_010255, partial [Pleopsidium flavum]